IDQHDAHELRLTGFLAEFRIDLKDQLRLRDAATNMADSAAVVAARTRPESRAVARSNTRAAAITHRVPDERRVGHAEVRHGGIGHLEVLLDLDGRFRHLDLRL